MLEFFRGKRVFITGHTGFKGSWLSKILIDAGALVMGYALAPDTSPNLFTLANLENQMTSVIGDIRDYDYLYENFKAFQPEIAIHMAAQPLVRQSYVDPKYTYETNVIGTVNFLECIRHNESVKSVLNVTTDKVYHNFEWERGYVESDILNGYDPYSNSKSCSELVTDSYRRSFFNDGPALSTARAGNVIGGGDFSLDRIIPDCVKAIFNKEVMVIRNPHSTRPYQHVLEPLFAYLMILEHQYHDQNIQGSFNVGPDDKDCIETVDLVTKFYHTWGDDAQFEIRPISGPHEAHFLKLNSQKIKTVLNWKPQWSVDQAIIKTVEWTKAFMKDESISEVMKSQIDAYIYDSQSQHGGSK